MGTWDSVRLEVEQLRKQNHPAPDDFVRRQKARQVEEKTERPLVIYASDFTDEEKAARIGAGLSIELEDKTGFTQALSDIPPGPLDILLHSPGGSPTATESLVRLIRRSYNPVRFIVPHTVKSAATMFALSGDEIVVSDQAEFGPSDPQLRFPHEGRVVTVPAQAAIGQFDRAYEDLQRDPKKIAVWLPILRQFGPSFLEECHKAIDLSKQLVTDWLSTYMLAGVENARQKAQAVASWLAEDADFKSHSRMVTPEQLLKVEPALKIIRLRELGEEVQSLFMDLYWAIDVTFNNTSAFKIIEHKEGSAYVRLHVQGVLTLGPAQSQPTGTPPLSRQQRRASERAQRKAR